MSRLTLNSKFRIFFLGLALIIAAVMLLSFITLPEAPKKASLYVALYDPMNVKQLKQDIWKYTYENGVKTGEEKIMSVLGRKENPAGDLVRMDLGENVIYKKQYLVTGIGNIIDLKSMKVLSDNREKFIKATNDSLIFYTNDIFKGKYYSVFKLNKGTYEKINDPMYHALPGQDIEVDYELQNRRIWWFPPNKDRQLLVSDAGFGEDLLDAKTKNITIPIYWIDNWNFIFPYYPITKNKATIIEVNVKTGQQIKLGDINDMPKGPEASYFKKDPDGNILYVCPKGNEIIDVKSKTIKTLDYYHCGNKFDVQVVPAASGRIIKFNGAEIGKYHCDLNSVRDCQTSVALEKKMKLDKEVFSQGIGVWNIHTKKWTTLMVDNVASIIGWVEE